MSAPTNSRRSLLAAAFAAPAAATLPALAMAKTDQIQEAADALAAAMARRHGGTWVACADHDPGFVIICPRTARGGTQ